MDTKKTISPSQWRIIGVATVAVVCALAAFTIWRQRSHDIEGSVVTEKVEIADENVIHFDDEAAEIAGIKLMKVSSNQMATGIAFNGQLAAMPDGMAQISSIVPGRVTKIIVAPGDKVRKGQTLAVVESQTIGDVQSAYGNAAARHKNAQSHLAVVKKQVRAGVFSRQPLENARHADAEATNNVRNAASILRQARIAMDNTQRQIKAGAYARPALETAKNAQDSAQQALSAAQAELARTQDQLGAAKAELERRQRLASAGAYSQKYVEEARRAYVGAQANTNSARSKKAVAQNNLQRAKVLLAEGLISKREFENTELSYDQSAAEWDAAQAEIIVTREEWERQKKIAAGNISETAEVNAARSAVTDAEALARMRHAELQRAKDALQLAKVALQREQTIYAQNIANRREISAVRTNVEQAEAALAKARQQKVLSAAALMREQHISAENLHNMEQLQSAEAEYRTASADLKAARDALSLLTSNPRSKASIPIMAPISGTISERSVTLGESIGTDKSLMTIINLDKVALEAAIYEKDIAQIRVGAPVTIRVDALAKSTFTGRITFLGAELHPKTRTLTARAAIDNSGALRPGMFARGEISTATTRSVVTVPARAVQTLDDRKVVFVRARRNTFVARPVQIGEEANGMVEIRSGLQPGEIIVDDGAFVAKSEAMKSELAED